MPSSPWSPAGVLTIVSLVALCSLSFIVVLGSDNIVNTQVRDTVYSYPKRDAPHHRRVFHHARVPVPQASAPPASDAPQSVPPAATPTPVEPSSPKQTPSSPNTTKQPPSAPSPSPAPSSSAAPASQPAQSSSPPSAPSSAAPSSSATPVAPASTSTPTAGAATTSNSAASLSQDASSSQVNTVSNIPNYSATAYSYSYQPGSITALGGTSTGPGFFPNTGGSTSTVLADSTAGATSSKGFFANKAGVGVTFAIVAIIGTLAIILGTRMVLRRYRNSREAREVDEWFEKYSTGHGSSNWHGDGQYARDDGPYAAGGSVRDDGQYAGSSIHDGSQYGGSPGGSSTDVAAAAATTAMAPAAPGAYPDRSVHYGRQNPGSGSGSGSGSGGVVLPPSVNFAGAGGSAAGAAALHSRRPSHSSGLRYSVTASQAQVGHPYAASVNPAYAAAAPPMPPVPHVPYPPAALGQEQADFAANGDPFYRPNATGAGVVRTGYAQ